MGNKVIFHIGLTTSDGLETLKAKRVIETVASVFAEHGWINFSVVKQTGYWEGKKEKSLAITVLDNEGLDENMFYIKSVHVGRRLAQACHQTAVLVDVSRVRVRLALAAAHIEP